MVGKWTQMGKRWLFKDMHDYEKKQDRCHQWSTRPDPQSCQLWTLFSLSFVKLDFEKWGRTICAKTMITTVGWPGGSKIYKIDLLGSLSKENEKNIFDIFIWLLITIIIVESRWYKACGNFSNNILRKKIIRRFHLFYQSIYKQCQNGTSIYLFLYFYIYFCLITDGHTLLCCNSFI